MERYIQLTADGSHTVLVPALNVTYHSTHGALQESRHVFTGAGLLPLSGQHQHLHIFEMGFGTGLNALLTLQEAIGREQAVTYHAIELYPLPAAELQALNYMELLPGSPFQALHEAPWEQDVSLHPLFTLRKMQTSLEQYLGRPAHPFFHLVYFHAFAPEIQPELWTAGVFAQLYARLHPGGRLVTYCSKGVVRRAMRSAGFRVEKLPGPPGKREILRATRPL